MFALKRRACAGMLEPAELRGGVLAFLAECAFAVITARDTQGLPWTSPLTGQPGFLSATSPHTLSAAADPAGEHGQDFPLQ